MGDREYITAPEAAKRFGLNRQYATRLAREWKEAGNPFPVKRGRSWEAPEEEWSKIFHPPNKKLRKSRKEWVEPTNRYPLNDPGISCSRAARKFGLSSSWAVRLSQRARKKGYRWPQKQGHQWIAPVDEWERIFNDPGLRRWKRKK